jgi:hypothetical protein
MGFDTREFEWSDCTILIGKTPIEGIQNFKYKTKRKHEVVRGKGIEPHSIQSGPKDYEGEIEVLQSVILALELAARSKNPSFDLTDISFDLQVTYNDGNIATTTRVEGCRITEYEEGMGNEDTHMTVTLPFVALRIKRGIK